MNKSIPVMGVPIVNGFEWLEKLFNSIDYPVENFLIIDNSGGDKKLETQIKELISQPQPYLKNIKVINFPSNMGVSFAWNFIIKSYFMSPYWIISSHDVSFPPGLLKEIAETAEDKEVAMIHPFKGEYGKGSFDLFIITEKAVQEVGLFDENLYPAYGEDLDYLMRLENVPLKTIKGLSQCHFHGLDRADGDYFKNGRQTEKLSTEIVYDKFRKANLLNFEYFDIKWGKGWRTFTPHWNPFQNGNFPNSYTTWDLKFIREKYLGF